MDQTSSMDSSEPSINKFGFKAEDMPAAPTSAQLSSYHSRLHEGGSRPSIAASSSYQMSLDQPQRVVDEPQQISHHVSPTARGFLPAFRIMVIAAALTLSFIIPWLMVTNLINPLIVWLICLIGAILELIYHFPVLVMEIIGMVRGRPCPSAWLQSGMDLTFDILFLLPWLLTAGLLSTATQIPACPPLFKPPQPGTLAFALQNVPGRILAKNYPTCQIRDTVVILSIANIILWSFAIALTAFAVDRDYRYQQKWYKHLLETVVDPGRPQSRRVKTARYLKDKRIGEPRRRWMTGTGQLLSEIEGAMAMLRRQSNRRTGAQRTIDEAQPITALFRDDPLEVNNVSEPKDQMTPSRLSVRPASIEIR